MLTLARMVSEAYTQPGQLVLDSMFGIGTTLVEAVHAGRDEVGVEYEPRWSRLARHNLELSVDRGAPGTARSAPATPVPRRTIGRRYGREAREVCTAATGSRWLLSATGSALAAGRWRDR